MFRYVVKRLLMIIPVILGVSFIIFLIMNLTPGDPAMMILGEGARPEEYAALREEMGLNDPFFLRYFRYVADAVQGDFGKSYRTNIPVFQEIASRLPYTLNLAVTSTLIAIVLGLPIGVLSAVKQYTLADNAALGVSLLLTSMPAFWFAMMLILLFSLKLRLLPSLGIDSWRHLILPAIATSSNTMASLLRMTRSTMLEVIRQDYIRTARAKGARESRVIFGHALRNALLPVVTIIGVNFGIALGGTIVVEQVFAIPGLGQLMVNAIRAKDTPMVIAAVLFAAIIASVVNLIVDIVYAYIDPRLKSKYVSIRPRRVPS
ncbi:ABC transporter permease [Aminithiophilus ramosus]|uniref:ABC transporter permease n=2 Tax=Synergistales TaxID=649776 RepID=A0A9Q7EWE1_9BACT|nr:ABC transporter permease [Aminithiophilus ramosus]QTX32739.1 ABC transporter permease [Aminithiophilus ramosus]QVL36616.1 ABC transporter permease [Synergistota bacterium]